MVDGSAHLSFHRDPAGGLTIVLGGRWRVAGGAAHDGELKAAIDARPNIVRFDTAGIESWDSALVSYAAEAIMLARQENIPVDRTGLPGGVQRLLTLAEAAPILVPPSPEARGTWLVWLGRRATERAEQGTGALAFVGEAALALGRTLLGRARFRRRDLVELIQFSGAQALGIVSIVSFLVGLVLAFVGAVELQTFGATIYLADLVGIAMVRELGALMSAIVVAGRTGAAFAAELGTMQNTEEIDAFATLGISPMEFLVIPRVVSLTLMLPLLCLYADLVGVLGGALVATSMLGLEPRVYYTETVNALTPTHLLGGVFKATVYGTLVAGAGCFEGLRSGRSAAGVGHAATAAVVDGIVLVIGACGLFAVLFYVLGI